MNFRLKRVWNQSHLLGSTPAIRTFAVCVDRRTAHCRTTNTNNLHRLPNCWWKSRGGRAANHHKAFEVCLLKWVWKQRSPSNLLCFESLCSTSSPRMCFAGTEDGSQLPLLNPQGGSELRDTHTLVTKGCFCGPLSAATRTLHPRQELPQPAQETTQCSKNNK